MTNPAGMPTLEPAQGAKDQHMVINMGPQHPATHGVLRLVLEIDGEIIVRIYPEIGYLHTGIEKTCEAKFYQQVVPLTDRINYLDPLSNNLCYALAVEKLLGLEIPAKGQWLRVVLAELSRLNSHLIWLGTHAMDIGALTVFLYTFREREDILRLFEAVAGQRMMTSYIRIGGVSMEPPLDFFSRVQAFISILPEKIDEYANLLTGNPIFRNRLKGVGYLSSADPRCAHRVWISIFAATCPTAATRILSSKCRRRPTAIAGRGMKCDSWRCARASRSSSRRLMACLKAP